MRVSLGAMLRAVHCDLEVIGSKYRSSLVLRLHKSDPPRSRNGGSPVNWPTYTI